MTTRVLLAAFVSFLVFGRSGLPWNLEAADLLFPALAFWVARGGLHLRTGDGWLGAWILGSAAVALAHPGGGSGLEMSKIAYGAAIMLVVREALLRGSRALAIRCFVVSATLVSALAIANAAVAYSGQTSWTPLLWRHPTRFDLVLWRARGLFEVPEMLGELLTVATPLALVWRSRATGMKRTWLSASVASLLLAGALSLSHAIVGLTGAILVFSWPGLCALARRLATVAWSSLFVIVVALSSALPRPAGLAPMSPFQQHVITSDEVVVWNRPWVVEWLHYGMLKGIALDAFLGSPLLGVGLGGFNDVAVDAYRAGSLTERHARADPHCELTGRLAETGLVGTLPMLLLWAFWLREGRSARDPYARAAGAAILGVILNGIHVDFMNFRFLWLAVAILESAPPTDSARAVVSEAAT